MYPSDRGVSQARAKALAIFMMGSKVAVRMSFSSTRRNGHLRRVDHDDFLLHLAGDNRSVLCHEDVDFGPHAKFGQVDTGLDRHTDAFD